MKYAVTKRSGNRKTGPIPVTTASPNSCPPSCPFGAGSDGRYRGCYASQGPLRMHWEKLRTVGLGWADFLVALGSAIRPGKLWRLNQAGDLPGDGTSLSVLKCAQLAAVNARHRAKGFGYTHYPLSPANRAVLRGMAGCGLVVNASCETYAAVDRAMGAGIPAAVVVPVHTPKVTRTAEGRRVVVCPAAYRDTSCADCGLCAREDRTYAIAFPVHGPTRIAGRALDRAHGR